MKLVLVAVDEHPHATKIVEAAVHLAAPISAKIALLYVITDKKVPARFVDVHGDAIPEHYYLDQYHRTVDALVKKVHDAGLHFEGICGVGDPLEVILKSASSRDASYIVVGVHGYSGLGKLKAVGNVARNVIEKSDVPVLAIP